MQVCLRPCKSLLADPKAAARASLHSSSRGWTLSVQRKRLLLLLQQLLLLPLHPPSQITRQHGSAIFADRRLQQVQEPRRRLLQQVQPQLPRRSLPLPLPLHRQNLHLLQQRHQLTQTSLLGSATYEAMLVLLGLGRPGRTLSLRRKTPGQAKKPPHPHPHPRRLH
jgi:hypothetical protein